ncbi:MAG: N-acetylmuramoyl-L-alanine amidase [Candidatus Omnitrophota bacterium]
MFKKLKSKNKSFFVLFTVYFLLSTFLNGCSTVSSKNSIAVYHINGTSYMPLPVLCAQRGIDWDYDTFTRGITLRKETHKINLAVGQPLIVIDGKSKDLKYPVEFYRGTIVVPVKFKEQVLDLLFKQLSLNSQSARKQKAFLSIKKVVIDAGHGGKDPGAIGRGIGLKEKDVNLDIALRLAEALKKEGIEVIMTRSTDVFIPLKKRVDIANTANADLFISIHANSNRVRSLEGFEVYYISENVSDSKRALSSAENDFLNIDKNCFDHYTLDLKAVLWDLIYTNSRAESVELAQAICHSVNRNLSAKVLGVKTAAFCVLKGTHMPAVLVETGFLSNRNEESLLKSGSYRQQVADAVFEGVEDYSKDCVFAEALK